jgi:hypothetical protein
MVVDGSKRKRKSYEIQKTKKLMRVSCEILNNTTTEKEFLSFKSSSICICVNTDAIEKWLPLLGDSNIFEICFEKEEDIFIERNILYFNLTSRVDEEMIAIVLKCCSNWITKICFRFINAKYDEYLDFDSNLPILQKLKHIELIGNSPTRCLPKIIYYVLKSCQNTLQTIVHYNGQSMFEWLNNLFLFRKLWKVKGCKRMAMGNEFSIDTDCYPMLMYHDLKVSPIYISKNGNIDTGIHPIFQNYTLSTRHKYLAIISLILSLRKSQIFPVDIQRILINNVLAFKNSDWECCIQDNELLTTTNRNDIEIILTSKDSKCHDILFDYYDIKGSLEAAQFKELQLRIKLKEMTDYEKELELVHEQVIYYQSQYEKMHAEVMKYKRQKL